MSNCWKSHAASQMFFHITVKSIIRETVENNVFFVLNQAREQINVSKTHRCSFENAFWKHFFAPLPDSKRRKPLFSTVSRMIDLTVI